MKVRVLITDEAGEVLEDFAVTDDAKMRGFVNTDIDLAQNVRDHIEHRFEVEEDE